MRPTVEGETPASEASSRLDSPTLTLARSIVDCIYALYRQRSVYAIDYGMLSSTVDPFASGQQRRVLATKKKAIQVILQDDPEAPECVRTVSLALGLLRHTKQRSWADLAAASAAAEESVVAAMGSVVLVPDQIDLVEAYEPMLGFIRWSAEGNGCGQDRDRRRMRSLREVVAHHFHHAGQVSARPRLRGRFGEGVRCPQDPGP